LLFCQLGKNSLNIGIFFINLVNRHDHRHTSSAGVTNSFNSLRHDTIVCRNHQNDDVGDLCTTGAHLREGCVTRRVNEGDLFAIL
jgi:hypothetical protein